MKLIADHIHAHKRDDQRKEYSLFFVPRRTMLCERHLEDGTTHNCLAFGSKNPYLGYPPLHMCDSLRCFVFANNRGCIWWYYTGRVQDGSDTLWQRCAQLRTWGFLQRMLSCTHDCQPSSLSNRMNTYFLLVLMDRMEIERLCFLLPERLWSSRQCLESSLTSKEKANAQRLLYFMFWLLCCLWSSESFTW